MVGGGFRFWGRGRGRGRVLLIKGGCWARGIDEITWIWARVGGWGLFLKRRLGYVVKKIRD